MRHLRSMALKGANVHLDSLCSIKSKVYLSPKPWCLRSFNYRSSRPSARGESDGRPTAKQLWKPHVGVLEMGVLGATGLMPMKIKEEKEATTRCILHCKVWSRNGFALSYSDRQFGL
ncbi:hypothetical protein IFM89_019739 [Coptis chinensis]|uniref:Uncharacterized protein n=1 Tax=Coptis chinensis TaxID=261450 RepID=A0A835H791_9MAGN|nr:hypothetical protein IFM89_019739 [Coptis chinensis]